MTLGNKKVKNIQNQKEDKTMTDFVARLIEVIIYAVVYAFVAMLTLIGTQALADKLSDWLANRKAEKNFE